MVKLMMDVIEHVLNETLETHDIDDIQAVMATLDDKQKIDLLDTLIEATMNYNDYFRDPESGPKLAPINPSLNGGSVLFVSTKKMVMKS